MKKYGHWIILTIAFILLTAFLFILVSPVITPPKWDEFIVLYDSHRLLEGQVPYRDFFNIIPPGAFYFYALVFKLTGSSSLTAGRYANLVVIVLTTLLIFLALRIRKWPFYLCLGWSFVPAVALYPFWAIPSHHWLATIFFIGLLALISRESRDNFWTWFAAGVLSAVTGLVLQSEGLLAVVFSLIVISLHGGKKKTPIIAWLSGLITATGPQFIYLMSTNSLIPFIDNTVFWPAMNYSRQGNENSLFPLDDLPGRISDIWKFFGGSGPLPSNLIFVSGMLLYFCTALLILIFLLLAVRTLMVSLKDHRMRNPFAVAATAVTILAIGLGLKGSFNWIHLVFITVPILVIWLISLGPWSEWNRWCRLSSVTLLIILLFSGLVYHLRGIASHTPESWELKDADRPVREAPLNKFLRSPGIMPPGSTAAVFPEGGEVYLYGTKPAVGYTYFTPLSEKYSTLDDHAKVAQQIVHRKAEWIVLPVALEGDYLDPLSPVAGVIRTYFKRQKIIGDAVLYRRKRSSAR